MNFDGKFRAGGMIFQHVRGQIPGLGRESVDYVTVV